MEPPWVEGTKVCLGGLGHMTKMAATLIYGKYLGLGMQNRGLGPNKVCLNDDLDLFYGKVKFALCFYTGKYRFLQEKCKKVI